MSANHVSLTNIDRAVAAWGDDMPAWVRLLASACDATSQRIVGDKIGRNSSLISRLINRTYTASYDEAEMRVRSAYGAEDVVCPVFGPIPLASCISSRRRSGPPRNPVHHQFASVCPTCANNTDGGRA